MKLLERTRRNHSQSGARSRWWRNRMGTNRLVTVDELVDLVCIVAGKTLKKKHGLSMPHGVRRRNSDNGRLRQVLGWEPSVPLEQGLEVTYKWIFEELKKAGRITVPRGKHAAV